jgi:hypothetical protein
MSGLTSRLYLLEQLRQTRTRKRLLAAPLTKVPINTCAYLFRCSGNKLFAQKPHRVSEFEAMVHDPNATLAGFSAQLVLMHCGPVVNTNTHSRAQPRRLTLDENADFL